MVERLGQFQGLMDLDPIVLEHLQVYLQEREAQLAQFLMTCLDSTEFEVHQPILSFQGILLKLPEAIEVFIKKMRNADQAIFTADRTKALIETLNHLFWDYTEILESATVELFERIHLVSVDRWQISLKKVISSIVDLLSHRIEDLMWVLQRLDSPLRECIQKSNKGEGWRAYFGRSHSYLDPELLKNLKKTGIYLKANREAFNRRYEEFEKLNVGMESRLESMKVYPILAILGISTQNLYVDVFRLLKMYEMRKNLKSELVNDLVTSLKAIASVEAIIKTFEIYYDELEECLYKSSLELKGFDSMGSLVQNQSERLKEKVDEFKTELAELNVVMSDYRNFLLKTDSNPYISSRWGFSEWIVGPEPASAKRMLHLIYAGTDLFSYYERFRRSLDKEWQIQKKEELGSHQQIEAILHEMGQPLISRNMMHKRVEKLLEEVSKYDELGSYSSDSIEYIGSVLAKAMREDWKYHVLHESPLFHEIMQIHRGLVGDLKDPSHAFRMERFLQLLEQLKRWIKKGNLSSHAYEVGLDINDMKSYLQDLLASVQRAEKERNNNPFLEETVEKFRMEVLEYRYVFSQFFHLFTRQGGESLRLRNQFIFVDQYFESVDGLLNNLSKSISR